MEFEDYLDDDIPADMAVAALGDEPPTDPAPTAAACALTLEPGASPTVSLYALTRVWIENTMLLPATVHGHCVVVLLDSGSTMNFINVDFLRWLQLATTPSPHMPVLVANGNCVPCEGVARQVALAIGSEEFIIDCFGISLGEFDLIMGVEFLRTLGPIL